MAPRLLRLNRVDDVPWPLTPFFWLFGAGLGVAAFLFLRSLRLLVRVRREGVEEVRGRSVIFCSWHENVAAWFLTLERRGGQAWINHPAWYMKPIHVLMRLVGIERIFLGSTGFGGRAAAEELAEALRHGASTTVFPDGPAGPLHHLHRGVLHLAAQSGLPIVPVRFAFRRAVRLPGWDGKWMPLPLGVVTVRYGAPLRVEPSRLAEAEQALVAALG